MNLFSSNRRGVVVTRRISGSPGTISIVDGFPSHESVIIQRIGYGQGVNVQFAPSLASLIYVYVFGDKMGDVTISGVCFDRTCSDGKRFKGAQRALSYYSKNRAAAKSDTINVTIGDVEINGFVIDMKLDTLNEEYRTMSFTMTMAALPRDANAPTVNGKSKSSSADATKKSEKDETKVNDEKEEQKASFIKAANSMKDGKINDATEDFDRLAPDSGKYFATEISTNELGDYQNSVGSLESAWERLATGNVTAVPNSGRGTLIERQLGLSTHEDVMEMQRHNAVATWTPSPPAADDEYIFLGTHTNPDDVN